MKDNKDRDEVLAAVKEDGNALEYADESLKKNKEIVMAAVKQDGRTLDYADESLKKNKDIVMAAVKQGGWETLDYADESLKKNKEIVMAAVKQNGWALQYADDSLKKDREIVLAAVKQNCGALDYADESLKKDKGIVLAGVKQNGNALQDADESLKKDKEIVMAAVKQDGRTLKYADKSLKKDRQIVLAAVKQNGYALQDADKSLKKDKEIVMAALNKHYWSLEDLDKSLRNDKEVVMAALKFDDCDIRYADDNLKADREVVLAALKKSNPNSSFSALEFADESLKADREIVLEAVRLHPQSLEWAAETLKADREIVIEAVKNFSVALRYANDKLKADREIILVAASNTKQGNVFYEADESFRSDPEIVLAAIKSMIAPSNLWGSDLIDEVKISANRELMIEAVKIDGSLLQYADDSLKKDKEVVLAAVSSLSSNHEDSFEIYLEYADDSLKKDREVVLMAVKHNCSSLEYASKNLQADREIVLAAVKFEAKSGPVYQRGFMLEYASDDLKADREIVLQAMKNADSAYKYASEELQNDPELKEIAQPYLNRLKGSKAVADKKMKKDELTVCGSQLIVGFVEYSLNDLKTKSELREILSEYIPEWDSGDRESGLLNPLDSVNDNNGNSEELLIKESGDLISPPTEGKILFVSYYFYDEEVYKVSLVNNEPVTAIGKTFNGESYLTQYFQGDQNLDADSEDVAETSGDVSWQFMLHNKTIFMEDIRRIGLESDEMSELVDDVYAFYKEHLP